MGFNGIFVYSCFCILSVLSLPSWKLVFVGYEETCAIHPFCVVNMKEVTYGNVISPSVTPMLGNCRLNYRVL